MAVIQTGSGKAIEITDLSTVTRRKLMDSKHLNISNPIWAGNYIYFNSPYSGIDNVYAVDIQSREQFQVTSRQFGAFNPAVSPDGTTLAFNDFTSEGFRIVTMPNDVTKWRPLSTVEDRTVAYYKPLIAQEGNADILAKVPDSAYSVRKYSQLKNLFNVHSWTPLLNATGTLLNFSLSS